MKYSRATEFAVRDFLAGFGRDIGWDSETLHDLEGEGPTFCLVDHYDELAPFMLADLTRWCLDKGAALTIENISSAKTAVRVGDDSFIGRCLEHALWEAFVGLAPMSEEFVDCRHCDNGGIVSCWETVQCRHCDGEGKVLRV